MLMSSGGYAASSSGCVTRGRWRLVRPDTPGQPNTLCSLAVMSWQRPNIGSRVTREGHARLWERPEAKFLRATRQTAKDRPRRNTAGQLPTAEMLANRLAQPVSAKSGIGLDPVTQLQNRFRP